MSYSKVGDISEQDLKDLATKMDTSESRALVQRLHTLEERDRNPNKK